MDVLEQWQKLITRCCHAYQGRDETVDVDGGQQGRYGTVGSPKVVLTLRDAYLTMATRY
jgi:hypothetical protein